MHPAASKAKFDAEAALLTPDYLRIKGWKLWSAAFPVLGVQNYGTAALRRPAEQRAMLVAGMAALGGAAILVNRWRKARLKERQIMKAIERDDRRLRRREKKRASAPPAAGARDQPPTQ